MTTTLRHVRVIERGQTFSAWVNPAQIVSIVPAKTEAPTVKIRLTNGGVMFVVGTTSEEPPPDISRDRLVARVAAHMQVPSYK